MLIDFVFAIFFFGTLFLSIRFVQRNYWNFIYVDGDEPAPILGYLFVLSWLALHVAQKTMIFMHWNELRQIEGIIYLNDEVDWTPVKLCLFFSWELQFVRMI